MNWYTYNIEEHGNVLVYPCCPECHKFLTKGILLTNMDGQVKLEKWICKTHGEIQPHYEYD